MDPSLTPEAVDCHLHAGLERRETFEEVFDYLRADGRRVVGLLDHGELYLDYPPDWAAIGLMEAAERAARAGLVDLYRKRLKGPDVFYAEARRAAARLGEGVRVRVGLEVSGPYLDRIDPGWLEAADFLGICANQPPEGAAWGEHMASLLAKADRLRAGRTLSLVLHHPFRWRLLELSRDPLAEIPEAGGFSGDDARTVAKALDDCGALAELNFASYWHLGLDGRLLRAAREAFTRLRDAGARFSPGSDFHAVTGLPMTYAPSKALEAFGLSIEDIELPGPFV